MSNSFGNIFRVASFGESHGKCVGIVLDGCPAGLPLEETDIQREIDKRKPQPKAGQTARHEEDKVEILAGVFEGHTSGAPLCILVWNRDIDSSQYEKTRFIPRPGHADYTAFIKYNGFNDYRGGGRFSGRITLGMVMAGSIAKKLLERINVEVLAYTYQIGKVKTGKVTLEQIRRDVYKNPFRCPSAEATNKMKELIEEAELEGDSLGGIVEGLAFNVPPGLGEPLFDTLEGELARALFAIPAVKGVEFGSGFAAVETKGSENNDAFRIQKNKVIIKSNNAGGVSGGISNGMPIVLRAAIKPTPSISRTQSTVNLEMMRNTEISVQGRHDVCIVPRAVIAVESMIAVTLCDMALRAGILPRIIK